MTSNNNSAGDNVNTNSLDNPATFAEAEIKQLEERLRQAMLTNDIAELDCLISERLLFVGPDGAIADKAAAIHARQTGVVTMSQLTLLSQRLEQYGSVIVVVASMQITGVFAVRRLLDSFGMCGSGNKSQEKIEKVASFVS